MTLFRLTDTNAFESIQVYSNWNNIVCFILLSFYYKLFTESPKFSNLKFISSCGSHFHEDQQPSEFVGLACHKSKTWSIFSTVLVA